MDVWLCNCCPCADMWLPKSAPVVLTKHSVALWNLWLWNTAELDSQDLSAQVRMCLQWLICGDCTHAGWFHPVVQSQPVFLCGFLELSCLVFKPCSNTEGPAVARAQVRAVRCMDELISWSCYWAPPLNTPFLLLWVPVVTYFSFCFEVIVG